jgi:hypothetical protein
MNPVDVLANVRALIFGLTESLQGLQDDVARYRSETRAKGFETDWGAVSFRKNPPKIKFNSKLLAWAEENMPHEVIPDHVETIPASVRPSLYKTLEERLAVDGDSVVDTQTGEVVDFATVEPGKPDSVVFTMPNPKKAEAVALVGERIEAVAAAITRELVS